ncbi:MAG: cobyrinate a,c-diamide synthase [Polyangiaceae bacterium]
MPRALMLAGTHSGVGKTTLCAALARLCQRRGLVVRCFKVGPDYLDPKQLRAIGLTCHSLDAWLMGREAIQRTFLAESADADVVLVEGMMGLFDGAEPTSNAGSSAEIAAWLGLPVVLVADASGVARSFEALVRGYVGFAPELDLVGVIANRVGGAGHTGLLRQLELPTELLGGVVRRPELELPERHLGLSADFEGAADERFFRETVARIDAWADAVQADLGFDEWLDARAARLTPKLASESAISGGSGGEERRGGSVSSARCRIGVARDAAFSFYYPENLRRLEEQGARLVEFSPLDGELPEVDAVYFGGGYPELHAARLAANQRMLAALRDHFYADKPVYAECGGLMYCCEVLRDLSGAEHALLGLLPAKVVMCEQLQAIGYCELELVEPCLLGQAGTRMRGHQFRHSRLEWNGEPSRSVARLASPRGDELGREGFVSRQLFASYVHQHWGRDAASAEHLVAQAARGAVHAE